MGNIIEIECPECRSNLWVDVEHKTVIQHKKAKKKNTESFDTLLLKEKEKKEKVDERFSMARKLEEEKKRKAEEIFAQSLQKKK